MNLVQKKVVEDSSCPWCGVAEETICHTLWECPAAQDVWGGNPSCFQKCHRVGHDFKLLFAYCLERVSTEELDLLAMVSRRIWLRRNSLIFEGTFSYPNVVFAEVEKSLIEFKRCQFKESSGLQDGETTPCSRNIKWQPTPPPPLCLTI
jgi:hypothetical protein